MRRIIVRLASVAALLLAAPRMFSTSLRVVRTVVIEWQQKRKLRRLLRRTGSIRYLEKGISADRSTTERLLSAMGARKSGKDEWTFHVP
jgi:dephospho-CoA kinase